MRRPGTIKHGQWTIAEVFEDVAYDQFALPDDPCLRIGPVICDEQIIGTTEDYNFQDQVKICRRLAKWLLRYADWIEKRGSKNDVKNAPKQKRARNTHLTHSNPERSK